MLTGISGSKIAHSTCTTCSRDSASVSVVWLITVDCNNDAGNGQILSEPWSHSEETIHEWVGGRPRSEEEPRASRREVGPARIVAFQSRGSWWRREVRLRIWLMAACVALCLLVPPLAR